MKICYLAISPGTRPIGKAAADGLRVPRQTDGISSKVKFAPDSPQEGDGFEISVPRCLATANSVGTFISGG